MNDISLRFEWPSWILLVLATRQSVEKCFIVRYWKMYSNSDLWRFLACNSLILYVPGKRWDLCLRPSCSLVIIKSTYSNRAQVKKRKEIYLKGIVSIRKLHIPLYVNIDKLWNIITWQELDGFIVPYEKHWWPFIWHCLSSHWRPSFI